MALPRRRLGLSGTVQDIEERFFTHDTIGRFLARPNRFVVEAESDSGLIRAHCANPGRMTEILLPGTKLYFERSDDAVRSTEYTVVAAEHRGEVVPLVSARANRVVECILRDLYPDAAIAREWRHGRSRFDFLVTESGTNTIVEAKSCSLSEYGVAMFPDAPTVRGRRHVTELAELAQGANSKRIFARIIFLITHGNPERFIPHVHADPQFAIALDEAAAHIEIDAFSVRYDSNGRIASGFRRVPVETRDAAILAKNNGGIYLLVLTVQARRIRVGGLGEIYFDSGFYVYVGSAARNLRQRISRHLRKRKKTHWHIDYLALQAAKIRGYPIFSFRDLECELARDVGDIASFAIERFGSSDCDCPSHLFYFDSDPLEERAFVDLLLAFRHRRAL